MESQPEKKTAARLEGWQGLYFDPMTKKFHVTLLEHDEGVSVSCQELPGCHSQGATVAEAMENIHDAIEGYLELYGQPDVRCQVREMEVVTG